jgi:hypothetical protein
MILKPEKEGREKLQPACTSVREKKIEGARESLLPLQDQVEVVEAVDVNGHLVRRLHRVGRRKDVSPSPSPTPARSITASPLPAKGTVSVYTNQSGYPIQGLWSSNQWAHLFGPLRPINQLDLKSMAGHFVTFLIPCLIIKIGQFL